jgi:predicted HAD superfamily Cof-like phosphohydrolase
MPTKLRDQLLEFHLAFGHYVGTTTVGVPPDDVVRLRARLIIEEAFEVLEAVFARDTLPHDNLGSMKKLAKSICATAPVDVDLPALADALGDTDYVVEGTRLAFGIDGSPIADAIHAANMAKLGGGKDAHGKSVKPKNWVAPNNAIAAELRRQGWIGQ